MIHFFASYVCVYLAARSLSVFLLATRTVCQHAIFTLSWSFTRSAANFDRNLARYVSVYRLALFFDVLMLIIQNNLFLRMRKDESEHRAKRLL